MLFAADLLCCLIHYTLINVRWICSVKVKDKVPSKELRERLGLDDIISVLQQNSLWWYGHVLQKEHDDWVKKYMEYWSGGFQTER